LDTKTIIIDLPVLHPGQVEAYFLQRDARQDFAHNSPRFKAIRCGRRWGKTRFGETWLADGAAHGLTCGWFAPNYKYIAEVYEDIYDILKPIKYASSKTRGVIRTTTSGRVDFWTLEDSRAGRSRAYHRVFIDEAAFTNPDMLDIWRQSIKPTLLDYTGDCIVASNTNGVDPENFLYAICQDPDLNFIEYHAPSQSNPHVPLRLTGELHSHWLRRQEEEYDQLRRREHPLVFKQEYLAEFIDWSGVAFFSIDKLLLRGSPAPTPPRCDALYAVLDTATKTGVDHDGSAITWFAYSAHGGIPLIIADWDIVQVEGAFLEQYLPSWHNRGVELAQEYRSRSGFAGIYIEDINTGSILLQKAPLLQPPVPVFAIPSTITQLGKDGRALNASGPVWREEVKLSRLAHDKEVLFKTRTRNHFVSQVTGFRLGDKDSAKRADDLLDTFTSGVALALGNYAGF
jgi:hypothetical protein